MDVMDDLPRGRLLFETIICRVAVWVLFQEVIRSQMTWQRIGDVLVSLFDDMDFQELWSIPSKGGGDDTNTFTTSFTNDSHVRMLHLLAREEAYMEMFTGMVQFISWYQAYGNSLVRRIWIISWSRAYSYFCTGGLSCLLGVLTQSLLLSVRWLELSVGLTYHLFRKVSRLDSVVRGRYLISCFTAHLVPGLHNMHWMDRNEVRMRFSEVFSVLSLCVKSATHLEQLRDALG